MIKQTYLIISILLGIGLTACQDYNDPGSKPPVVDGNMIEVSIKTNVPAITVQTKAGATDAEKRLTHVDILVFEVDEQQQKELFAYRTQNTNNLEELDYDNVEIKTKLLVSETNEKYRIVFIANLKNEIEEFFGDNESAHAGVTSKEDLLKEIVFKQQNIWRDIDADPQPLPMWGENSTPTVITTSTNSTSFGELKLLRSVARIGLSVSLNGSQQSDGSEVFEIKSVRVYNARVEGRATPDADNMDPTKEEAKRPTLVSNSALIDTETSASNYILPSGAGNKAALYINEASNQTEGEEVFLVIKAIYKKDNPTNKETFYKIGFYNIDDDPVDILRNFTYNMVITSVGGQGEEEEDKAVRGTESNLIVSMTNWSDGKMKHVVFNGQYYLAVSESTITVPKAESTHSFLVETNYTHGWSAEITAGNSWIKNLSPGSSTNLEVKEDLSFAVEENPGNTNREGVISISCGNLLTLDVDVIQTAEEGISLKIEVKDINGNYVDLENSTLHFHSGNHYEIDPQVLKVSWTPVGENLVVDYDRFFEWDDATNLQTIYEGGTAYLTIAPARMLTRPENASDPLEAWFPSDETPIHIQVGGASTSKQTISVKKQHYEVYLDRVEKYKLDGEKHSFKLYSNSPSWIAKFVDTGGIREYIDIDNIPNQENPPTGGNNVENGTFKIENGEVIIENAGQSIEFILKKPPTGSSINAEVLIQITYDDFGKEIVKEYTFRAYYEDDDSQFIAGGDANCYMLKPSTVEGSKKIHIPVSQANRVPAAFGMGQQISDDTQLTPCFIWTDHPGGLGVKSGKPQHAVYEIKMLDEGKGPGAILEVTPGNAPGNAVVGIKNAAGEILWSWHLWVSDFDPVNVDADRHSFRNYQFLDRNLGALSDDPTKQESFGLYYQWGRKDPFPSAKASKSTEFVPIYNELGTQIYMTSSPRGDRGWGTTPALKESIRNPLNFITSGDWWCTGDFTNYGQEAMKFWSENETNELETATKGVFDPCPDGWKTVPASTTSNNKEWYVLFNACKYESNGHYSNVEGLGVWPHVGYIGCNSATISEPEMGRYWTGNKPDLWSMHSIHFMFDRATAHPSETYQSSSGLPVRCMRRTTEMR